MAGTNAVYHCISRIVGAEFLLEGEREKEVLRNQIWKVADFCGVQVLTYCIMSNHVHILLRTPNKSVLDRVPNAELARRAKRIYAPEVALVFERGLKDPDPQVRQRFRAQLLARMGDVSQYMKELKQRFSIWYNRNHNRAGTLWMERFKSVLIEDDPMALATVAAYIDLNPVRAQIVDDPSQYRFCGYAEAMGGHKPAREGIAGLAGCQRINWGVAIAAYRLALFGKGRTSADAGSVNSSKAARIMNEGGSVPREEALRCRVRYFTDGVVLGSTDFVQCYLDRYRAALAARRRPVPRPLAGSDWRGLACLRGLRRKVFS